jgi:hypothetical protein
VILNLAGSPKLMNWFCDCFAEYACCIITIWHRWTGAHSTGLTILCKEQSVKEKKKKITFRLLRMMGWGFSSSGVKHLKGDRGRY